MNSPARMLAALIYFGGLTGTAVACPGQLTVWDLTLGTRAADLPGGFIEYACGTNGGPPSRPIANFEEFGLCEADDRGFYEVYFRYNDEAEFVARALEQQRRIEMCEGTEVHGVPVIASALFDLEGVLSGIRLVSDARGTDPADRNDHWALGAMLRRQFSGGWTCNPNPLPSGNTPAAGFVVNQECTLSAAGPNLLIRQEYFHRIGQSFRDEFGDVQPDLFVSGTYFEMVSPHE